MTSYSFVLYTAGQSSRSEQALENLRRLCAERLESEQFEINQVDVIELPERAEVDRIIATPCVVRALPLPSRRVIGDLSAVDRVAVALGLPAGHGTTPGGD